MTVGEAPSKDALRAKLVKLLNKYHGQDSADDARAQKIRDLVNTVPECASRACYPAHLTGSAWIVNASGSRVLLMHHVKLARWLQLGGHADGNLDLQGVAWNEAREESGLLSVRPLMNEVFDVDIHTIPPREVEPEHLHYDIRFVFFADEQEPLEKNREAHALAWVSLDQLEEYTHEPSVLRMREKWQTVPGKPVS